MPEQEITDFDCCLDIAFNIEIVVQIRFRQTDFGSRQEHSGERAGMFQHERCIVWPRVWPHLSVPKPNAHFLKGAARENFA
jgi:hypothetical protein